MPNKINLLYVINSLNNGGAETLAIRLAGMIDRGRFSPYVCSLSDSGPLREVLESRNIPFVTLGKKEGKDVLVPFRLRKVLKELNIDIIHTHNQGPLLYSYLATILCRKYLLVHTEHINMLKEFSYERKHLLYNSILYRKLDGFISIAEHLTADFETQYNLSRARVSTISNCVEIHDLPCEVPVLLKEELGIGKEIPLIGNISALREQKDHVTLLRAMGIIQKTYPDAILAIAGDGELRDELTALTEQLGLTGTVRFLGYRSDVNTLLYQFDIFVLSSLYEGLPLCILEAMAAGKPIVATDADGTNELIIDGETGLTVPVKDPAQLASAIMTLLEDPARAQILGGVARRRVEEKYNMKQMIEQYEQYYNELYHSSQ